jgi:hypothetical protein
MTLAVHRRQIRMVAAAMAAVSSAIYFLIGFQVVAVIDDVSQQAAFGIPAGLAFALAAIVLLRTDHRFLWVGGAILQFLIIAMYFSVAPQRSPQYEIWGILIRVAQVVLLACLVALSFKPRTVVRAA